MNFLWHIFFLSDLVQKRLKILSREEQRHANTHHRESGAYGVKITRLNRLGPMSITKCYRFFVLSKVIKDEAYVTYYVMLGLIFIPYIGHWVGSSKSNNYHLKKRMSSRLHISSCPQQKNLCQIADC